LNLGVALAQRIPLFFKALFPSMCVFGKRPPFTKKIRVPNKSTQTPMIKTKIKKVVHIGSLPKFEVQIYTFINIPNYILFIFVQPSQGASRILTNFNKCRVYQAPIVLIYKNKQQ
jgi:hypothetical protein